MNKLHMKQIEKSPGFVLFFYHYAGLHGYVKFMRDSYGAWKYYTIEPLHEPMVFNSWVDSPKDFVSLKLAKDYFKFDYLGMFQ